LRKVIRPFVLRRLKTDPAIIRDLPKKEEIKTYCNLTPEQATLYEAFVQDTLNRIDLAKDMERRGLILAMLTGLKQICNHPAHFLKDQSPLEGRSGKLTRLIEMLDEVISGGDSALVFTQFVEMGELLKRSLEKSLDREVLFLHGGVPAQKRAEMVDRFQSPDNGPTVFVLSLRAGGTGLNLTSASRVFHYDRWWNPAVENQATDRAFRIGQTQNVQVYKFICRGTLEERIDALIDEKKALAETVIGSGEEWVTELSTDELRRLIALDPEAVVHE
jgi:SNF2 family DNA or RNA helicase